MNRYQTLVQDFHVAMGLPVGDYDAPTVNNSVLRTSLINEELTETIDAFNMRDLVGVIDGLADTVYVGAGTAVQYGLILNFKDTPTVAKKIGLTYPKMFINDFKELRKEILEALSCDTCLPKIKFYLERLCFDCCEAASDFGVDLWSFFQEVHRSNMSKVGGPIRADGKRLKPPNWQPPRIREMLIETGWRP